MTIRLQEKDALIETLHKRLTKSHLRLQVVFGLRVGLLDAVCRRAGLLHVRTTLSHDPPLSALHRQKTRELLRLREAELLQMEDCASDTIKMKRNQYEIHRYRLACMLGSQGALGALVRSS